MPNDCPEDTDIDDPCRCCCCTGECREQDPEPTFEEVLSECLAEGDLEALSF